MVSTRSLPSASWDHCADRWLKVGTAGPANAPRLLPTQAATASTIADSARRRPLYRAASYGRGGVKSSAGAAGFELLPTGDSRGQESKLVRSPVWPASASRTSRTLSVLMGTPRSSLGSSRTSISGASVSVSAAKATAISRVSWQWAQVTLTSDWSSWWVTISSWQSARLCPHLGHWKRPAWRRRISSTSTVFSYPEGGDVNQQS